MAKMKPKLSKIHRYYQANLLHLANCPKIDGKLFNFSLERGSKSILWLYSRGFKGKRPNSQDVSKAQEESEDPSRSSPHISQFSNDGNSFSHQFQRQNQFSNDGSFLEQFKKLKEQPKNENEQVAPVQQEAQPAMPSPSEQNDWYKAALARAKQIAHTMTAPMEPKKDPDAKIKDEPKPEPKGTSITFSLMLFLN